MRNCFDQCSPICCTNSARTTLALCVSQEISKRLSNVLLSIMGVSISKYGKTPDELKNDPDLNIRGAAALLKKLYDENPKPDFAKPDEIESWYNAVIKYCGIPEPFLSHQHALNCYVFMSKGYNQYGMHWQPHPVNLEPMRADVIKLRKEFDEAVKKRQATNVVADAVEPPADEIVSKPAMTNAVAPKPAEAAIEVQVQPERVGFNVWPWLGMGMLVCVIAVIVLGRSRRRRR